MALFTLAAIAVFLWIRCARLKARDTARRDTQREYQRVVESTFEGIWMVDAQSKTTFVNGRMAAMLGYTPEEMMGRRLADFVADDGADLSRHNLARGEHGASDTHDFKLRRKDGSELWTLMTTNTVTNGAGEYTGALALVVDITLRKQAEGEVHQLNEELEARVRARTAELEAANRELEAFSYSVSHDLRAPLRTITGFCRILEREHASELSPAARRYLGLVHDGATHMASLIDDLLAFSRLSRQAIERKRVEPADLVNQVLADLHGEVAGRNIEWKIGTLPSVAADPVLLRHVFLNLLSNAAKFTRSRTPAVIEVGCTNDEAAPTFYVRDNGVGFDMQYAHKLFGVFQRLHRADEYEGTGVGLAIVHRVLARQGGRVWADAQPDGGATFYFTVGPQEGQESRAA